MDQPAEGSETHTLPADFTLVCCHQQMMGIQNPDIVLGFVGGVLSG